jgi:tRNA dimethylallyltransferase
MIIVLTGPTGSGKSELAVSLANRIGGEIINADAFQVYEELTIATACPSKELQAKAPHHLYGFVPLNEDYDIAHYQADCRKVIQEVLSRGKTPILVGGSGLYIRSALFDYDFSLDTSKVDLAPFESLSDEELHQKLASLDPLEAEKIPFQNRRRALRAIAICLAAGESKSSLLAKQTHAPIYEAMFFGLTKERDELYPLVEERVEKMFNAGLLDETVPLIKKYGRDCHAFKAIGVKELFPYIDGVKTLDEAKKQIKTNTRHYVKEQETWFRHQFNLVYVSSLEEIIDKYEHR